MSDTSHVAVHNPETGGNWDCPAGYLDVAREKGWEVVSEQPVPTAYDGQTNEYLRDEIAKRNADLPDEEQLSTAGNKPDLIATLIADDARRGTTGSNS